VITIAQTISHYLSTVKNKIEKYITTKYIKNNIDLLQTKLPYRFPFMQSIAQMISSKKSRFLLTTGKKHWIIDFRVVSLFD